MKPALALKTEILRNIRNWNTLGARWERPEIGLVNTMMKKNP